MKNKIIFVVLIILIFSSNLYASTDTMSTSFQNMSKESWLKITDYLYDNIENTTTKALLQPLTSNGDYATTMYTKLNTYINDLTIISNDETMIRKIRYAKSDLGNLTFIVYNNQIYIYTNDIYKKISGTTGYAFENYEKIDTASYSFNGNSIKFYGDSSSSTVFTNNRQYLYINLNNQTISYGSGNYSNLGSQLSLSSYTVTQNDDLTLWSYGSNVDSAMIVQFAGSGTQGNPIITYYLRDYSDNSSTLYPMFLRNAVYLDGSENTGGSTGGNTGEDTGGGNTGGNTGGGNIDLGQVEEELGNISGGINNPDSTLNNNLDDIENAINNNTDYISKEPVYDENGNLAEEQPGLIGQILQGFWNLILNILNYLLQPNESQIQDLVDDVTGNDIISESILGLPLQLISKFLNVFISSEYGDWVIKWDDINFTFSEKDGSDSTVKMFSGYTFNISEFVRTDETLSEIYSYYLIMVEFGAICGLIYWCSGFFKDLLGISEDIPGANDETESPEVGSTPEDSGESDSAALERYLQKNYNDWTHSEKSIKRNYKVIGKYRSINSDMKAGRYKKK